MVRLRLPRFRARTTFAAGQDGSKGDAGGKGDTGDTGGKGDKGDTGDTGAEGPPGLSASDFVWVDATGARVENVKGDPFSVDGHLSAWYVDDDAFWPVRLIDGTFPHIVIHNSDFEVSAAYLSSNCTGPAYLQSNKIPFLGFPRMGVSSSTSMGLTATLMMTRRFKRYRSSRELLPTTNPVTRLRSLKKST